MFLFFSLTKAYNWTDPGNYNQTLSAGYYKITIIGAQGGLGCNLANVAKDYSGRRLQGGHGAIISGILHLQGNYEYNIVVGDTPKPNCSIFQNPGSIYGGGGRSGIDLEQRYGGQSGGGGGYSLFGLDFENYIVIAGGGGGATYYNNGGSAGGRGSNFKIDNYYKEVRCRKRSDPCFSKGRNGGNGIDSKIVPGGGGGGGFIGGYQGVNSILNTYYSAGKGGSSNWKDEYFYSDVRTSVGIDNNAIGNGSLYINPIKLCKKGCYDCEFENIDVCTECEAGKYLFAGACYKYRIFYLCEFKFILISGIIICCWFIL